MNLNRRCFLTLAGSCALGLVLPDIAPAAINDTLSFIHLHTGERLRIPVRTGQRPEAGIMQEVDYFLRDFRTGDVHPIDPQLLDILCHIKRTTGGRVFAVISGYRSPATNAMLRKRSRGVARKSLHLQGRAIDIRLSGVRTSEVRHCAMKLRRGGVGYYPKSDFVHLDTGRVRYW